MEEYSDSNYSSNLTQAVNSTRTLNNHPLQKYKGVVLQPNGNWGAQIYADHKRIWLGTFKTEFDAAVAYDRASIKLRSAETPRNFTWTKLTPQEAKFQSRYSMETILKIIKDGSYNAKFEEFKRREKGKASNNYVVADNERSGFSRMLLFRKELTPSDVGKLNRLVIPKKYAVQCFPPIPDVLGGNANDEVHLSFYDTNKKMWKFRYCYWKSSQSYVFTRGWNQFIKEKKLRAKDHIAFYYYRNLDEPNMWFWVIDVSSAIDCGIGASPSLVVGSDANHSLVKKEVEDFQDPNQNAGSCQTGRVERKGIKLFGVQINID